jgi:glycosyltransferase involved in cell wall biosynthesis
VIIPTTGAPEVRDAIDSVLKQTIETQVYLICDGRENQEKVKRIADQYAGNGFVKICYLPINVGANGFYGHRVYAAFTHLIDTQYVLYLDQDNTFKPDHVETCINVIEKYGIDWCYSLRSIIDKDGEFVCNDDCESLGKWQTYHGINHVDTNCYCIKTEIAVKLASAWHGGWGQDRVFLHTIAEHFPRFECTRKYTVNYRVNGNPGSVTPEFFENGNRVMNEKYNGEFPWQKEI